MDPHYQSIWFNLGAGLADMIVGMVTPNTKGAGHGRLELPCHNLKQTPYVSDGMWSFMSPGPSPFLLGNSLKVKASTEHC